MLKRLSVYLSLAVFALAFWLAFAKIFLYGLRFVLTVETYWLACACFVVLACGSLGVVLVTVIGWLR